MDSRKFKFLKAVLGEDGAKALAKAAERGPELENALLPRTIMAWLSIAGRSDFEGQIPGVENTYIQFTKSENTDAYAAIHEQHKPRFRAAFHHVPTQKTYVPKLPIHDFDDVAEQAGVPREEIGRGQSDGTWISGFVDHEGKFYNRDEASAAVGIKPRPGYNSALESTNYLEGVERGVYKSVPRYSGSVAVGDEVYSFDAASMLHLGACMAVALGADHERLSPGLRDLDIQRLGKNIDTLVKARIAVAELRKMRTEDMSIKKAIGAIQPGVDMLNGSHDYTHVLAPEHQRAGYKIHVQPVMVGGVPAGVRSNLTHNGNFVGQVVASHDPDDHSLSIADANLSEGHRGRGLGTHMYEALMAHSFHHFGANQMQGGSHSTAASKVHQALSAKHGLGYQAQQKANAVDRPQGDYDAKLGGYQYAIKAELEMTKAVMKPHGGVEAPGPAAAPRPPDAPLAPLPPVPTQTSKGPVVGLHPKPPKLPTPKSADDQIQTGHGIKHPKAKNPTLKVTKSQAKAECPSCGGTQFQGSKFTGCLCFQTLSKSIKVTVSDDGYNLEFKADWDQDQILTLIESMGTI